MGFKSKLSKNSKFSQRQKFFQRRHNEILNNTDAEHVEHNVIYENGYLVQEDYYIDGESVTESLEAKKKYLDGASAKARKKREKDVAKAEDKGRPLNEEVVLGLRQEEEDARLAASKEIADMKRLKSRRYGR